MIIRSAIVWVLLGLVLSGCTLKASIESATDGTTNFVSSTTGKTWWNEEGLVKQGAHAGAFVSVNYENLLYNMAQGEGEYLLAFGKILKVSSADQEMFANRLQQHYANLSGFNVSENDIYVKQFINEVIRVTENSSTPYL